LYCDGARFDHTVQDLYCELPVKKVLQKEPFNLEFDDLVQVVIYAQNSKGWSDPSTANIDGARIQSEALSMNAPVRDPQTNTEEIFVTWLELEQPENGNSDVISYSLEYDAGTQGQVYQAVVGYLTDYTGLEFSVTEHIVRGQTFRFRLRAKNMWGWGAYSDVT